MSNCICKGCETQAYYDRVRSTEPGTKKYTITVMSDDGRVQDSFHKELDLYDYYNIVAEYFGVQLDLDENLYEEEGCTCGGYTSHSNEGTTTPPIATPPSSSQELL